MGMLSYRYGYTENGKNVMNEWLQKLVMVLALLMLSAPALAAAADNETNARFLVLSDIHFDPFASCKSPKKTPCPLVSMLRSASVEEWSRLLASRDTKAPVYRQDTSYPLLVSALREAKSAAAKQGAQFVLILGDFISHDFRGEYKRYSADASRVGYESFVKKTLTFLTQEIEAAFPDIDVYMVVGNNDSYRRNYYSNPNGPFFTQMAVQWSHLIKTSQNRAAMRNSFSTAGYYAVTLPDDPSMRLLVLNTVLFSNKAVGVDVPQAAAKELKWLHEELETARKNQQRVLIAMHIPEGIDIYTSIRIRLIRVAELWQPVYSQQFQAELKQYAPNIAGILAGHLHANWFHLLRFENLNDVPFLGTTSISPIYGNDPGFSIYQYSDATGQLNDFIRYSYPLNSKQWTFSLRKSKTPVLF